MPLEQTYWTGRTASISILPRVTVFLRWKCFRKSLQPERVIFC
ncbi:Uncharacterised protein [Klebsiella pneumoniae]|nr:Uncharacterised protein [Klebsiella pneumoniae]